MNLVDDWRGRIERRLDQLLPRPETSPETLHEAMRHSVIDGGKRLRPLLCLGAWKAAAGAVATEQSSEFLVALDAGCAVELLHGYSLVHDDLPAMDNDDLRRGRLSCHKAFGEAVAILAGDTLQALAFETLAGAFSPFMGRTGVAVVELARAAGGAGMCGGQMLDLDGEKKPASLAAVEAIARTKTAALIVAACRLGGLAAGAGTKTLTALGEFGQRAGVMYQVVDDLLDVTATTTVLGKTAGKDQRAGKQTFVAALGMDGAREKAGALHEASLASLAELGPEADFLRELVRTMHDRGQ